MKIDIISDLHIDHWSKKYKIKYPSCEPIEKPYEYKKSNSDILIIAGDISDDLDISIDFLNRISKFYKKVLFVDGNHEHVNKYPNLYNKDYINEILKKNNNNKIVYLPSNQFIINKTLFIGCCGWWNYNNSNLNDINNSLNYFQNWINFSKNENKEFINNVIKKSKEEFKYLNDLLLKYKDDNNIEKIIIVSHTIPHKKYCDTEAGFDNYITQHNSKFNELLLKYKKINTWIFGHSHRQQEDIFNNIKFISNPRGRPNDFNRLDYNVKQINI